MPNVRLNHENNYRGSVGDAMCMLVMQSMAIVLEANSVYDFMIV